MARKQFNTGDIPSAADFNKFAQMQNDTAANWTSANPVLAMGDIGTETDTKKFKRGDGVTAWSSLSYCLSDPSSVAITGGTIGGSTSIGGRVFANVYVTNTPAQNAAAIQAAHDSLGGMGGEVWLPAGPTPYQVSGGLSVFAGRTDALGAQGVIFVGGGIGGTQLVMTNTAGALFQKTSGHAHGFRNLSLIGPGAGTAAVGIDWTNAAGGTLWENVWIEGFGVGSRFDDATSMTFVNCHWHANGDNVQLGYNCDMFQFYGGRIQNATGNGVLIGYYSASHAANPLNCSPVNFNGVRFGANARAMKILDNRAEQIVFDKCYFENNTKIAEIGAIGTAQSAKNVAFDKCFFTVLNAGATQVECLENTSNCTIEFKGCTQDNSSYSGLFAQVGTSSSVLWERNRFPITGGGAHVKIGTGGASYVIADESTWRYNENVMDFADGALQATSVPARHMKMTNGTDKAWQRWSRNSSASGAEVGNGQAQITDIGGQWVVFDGVHRVGTPSAALPTAAVAYRGVMAYQQGGAGVADTIVCCMKSTADTYSWKVVSTG